MGRQRDETGAISVLLAALSFGLVVMALAGANAAGLLGVRREAQRAANLSALAGAASLPLVGLLSSPEPRATACRQIDNSFDPSSALLAAELGDGNVPRCDAGATVSAEADWASVEAVRTALDLLIAGAELPVDLCTPLLGGLLDPLVASLTDLECASLEAAIDGLPDNLSPAVLTPRVTVSIEGDFEAFVPLPAFAGNHTVDATATARRRFKNLVVLPAVNGAPQPLSDLNPTATAARDTLLPASEQANSALAAALNPLLSPAYNFDLSGLFVDLYDLYDPPGTAPAPSPLEVAQAAVDAGDPVILLRLFEMPVLGIPVFDFTAAYLHRLDTDTFGALPLPAGELAGASGLFGATLVRSSGSTL